MQLKQPITFLGVFLLVCLNNRIANTHSSRKSMRTSNVNQLGDGNKKKNICQSVNSKWVRENHPAGHFPTSQSMQSTEEFDITITRLY